MIRYYTQHNMIQCIDQLYKTHTTMSRNEVRNILDKWDNDQGRAMEYSEALLRTPPKKYRWSPVLRNSAILRRYWKLRLREALHSGLSYTDSFTRWQQQIQTYDPDFVLPRLGEILTLTVIREHFNRATRAFRRCQKDSVSLRMKCYSDLLDTYEDDMNPETKGESQRKATIVRRTLDSETLRGTFRNLRRVVNPTEMSGLTKLIIPRSSTAHTAEEDVYRLVQETDPNDLLWETIIDRADIERQLLIYNRNHFRAAAESPCGRGLIHDAITF
jgi:hypothetical protein